MTAIPNAVLSEHFQERLSGKRLLSAVFFTFQFDPGFFEQEILPVLMDVPLSHAAQIRIVQLEDALANLAGDIAVYYDVNGLSPGDAGPAKLDIRRIPIRYATGIFHPKMVLLLVESDEEDPALSLVVGSLSANLTRSGWWENVECCHVEEIEEGANTRLKDDLVSLLRTLKRMNPRVEHRAVDEMLDFLRGVEMARQRSRAGRLLTHLYAGVGPVADFLSKIAGDMLGGMHLEIISPYFDVADDSEPLHELISRFQPRDVCVFLPRSPAGDALVRRELYESVRSIPSVTWGRLPKDLVTLGKSADAGQRPVHAKVYRFFDSRREFIFVGSANMTQAAHQRGGNLECGFLVEVDRPRRPTAWLQPDERKPLQFSQPAETDDVVSGRGSPLRLQYRWDTGAGAAFWDAPTASPQLRIEAAGVPVGVIPRFAAMTWVQLEPEMSARIAERLRITSVFTVKGHGDEAQILVQEEGMSHKPSLLWSLSAADILRYWTLLTDAQRSAFLEARAPAVVLEGEGSDLVTRARIEVEDQTMFDRFAGIFHAFSTLEDTLRRAFEEENDKVISYRLFGDKYDSLGSLLDRVGAEGGDLVDSYVIVMCARQLNRELKREFPDAWSEHQADAIRLETRIAGLDSLRERLTANAGEDMERFLDWFDRWFLRRAERLEVDA